MRWILLVALALAVAGCGGGSGSKTSTSAAPAQSSLRLAAVRLTTGSKAHLDLVQLDPDGANVKVLVVTPSTHPPLRRLYSPAWAADGASVYFAGETGTGEAPGFTYPLSDAWNVGAGGVVLVTRLSDVLAALPSPDGNQFLLERMEHPRTRPFTTSIWRANADGTNQTRLLDLEDGRIDIPGGWSPDGSEFAFSRCAQPEPDADGRVPNTCAVYTADADGGNVKKLADRARDPVFSPDGTKIAFASDRDQHGVIQTGEGVHAYANELYVMDADGKNPTRITTTEGSESQPAWSPDGSRIAYQVQGENFAKAISLTDPKGTCSKPVAGTQSQWYQEPVWRPGALTGQVPALCG